jgi:hypothetical protein
LVKLRVRLPQTTFWRTFLESFVSGSKKNTYA